ncbi:hypothetical protein [Serratia symbiotica]|uniref:Uncharacterized protein n=1 Tax=Serratia symbiotica TaxID=138074 RepID=A0A068Z1W4_9GAMM|nr:hypothetical protein [Serratia symbiotica]MBQ0956975.1 hypothetical protein [Serratia symbiotica]QLH63215.1 hypothetical protein SYMBAF_10100 [Serratia symbiotica]CDS57775.1 conserved hypothetical protein [Serratia symbiotica]
MKILMSDITGAMRSSIEGYAFSVVDSMEFSLGRDLTTEEQDKVFHIVDDAITRITNNPSP